MQTIQYIGLGVILSCIAGLILLIDHKDAVASIERSEGDGCCDPDFSYSLGRYVHADYCENA